MVRHTRPTEFAAPWPADELSARDDTQQAIQPPTRGDGCSGEDNALLVHFGRVLSELHEVFDRLTISEARYHALISGPVDFVARMTPDGRLSLRKRLKLPRYYGRTREELLGRAFNEFHSHGTKGSRARCVALEFPNTGAPVGCHTVAPPAA